MRHHLDSHERHREDCWEDSGPDPGPCLQRSLPRSRYHASLIVENAVAPASFHDPGLRVPHHVREREYAWPALGEVHADVVAIHRADVVESSRNDMIQAPRWGDIGKGEIEAPRV